MQGLYQLDESIYRAIHSGVEIGWLNPIGRMVNDSGLGHVSLLALLICGFRSRMGDLRTAAVFCALIALVVGIEKDWATGLAVVMLALIFWRLPGPVCFGAMASGAITGILRAPLSRWVERPRPSNLHLYTPLEDVYGKTSFPSGHSSTSFGIAVFVIYALWNTEYRPLCYPVAIWSVAASCSRVFAGVHYPSDVLGGLCMAGIGGTLVWLWLRRKVLGAMTPAVSGSAP